MVDVEPLSADDRAELHAIVREHGEETGSAVAAALLTDWDRAATRFSKIMPRDYKRVLDASARARAEGRDELTAIMEATHG